MTHFRKLQVLHISALALCLSTAWLSSCSDDDETPADKSGKSVTSSAVLAQTFSPDDGSPKLSTNANAALYGLLKEIDPSKALDISNQNIKPEEYAEIKDFTDKLTKGIDDEEQIFKTAFDWVATNVRPSHYDYCDNDPYPVFTERLAVCQGYSNLLAVMLYSQGIPVFNANGMYNPIGGHAWNYAYVKGRWLVVDATFHQYFTASSVTTYKHLEPYTTTITFFEDEQFVYDFRDSQLNVCRVKHGNTRLTVPFSAGGYQITSFNPQSELPESIKEIYIGTNIKTLGEAFLGMLQFAPNVSAVYVDENNAALEGYGGVVYKKNGSKRDIYFIPPHIESIKLLPMERVEKNTIYNCKHVRAIVFPTGVKTIENYAVENCPSLETVYVPVETEIEAEAFYRCGTNFEIVRGDFTGIPRVRL